MKTLSLLCLLVSGSTAVAQDTDGLFSQFDLSLGVDSGGAIMFRDMPDGQLAPTSAFKQGVQVAMRLGDLTEDAHAFGVAFGYSGVARSTNRTLSAFDSKLLYAAGGATEVQIGLGYRVGIADPGFKLSDGTTPYSGPLGSVEIRHLFLDPDANLPLGLAASLYAEGVANGTWSTAHIGTRIEFVFRKAN